VARLLALAHEIERRIRAGELDDLAHAARAFGLTRARITQIVSLTLLAPAIQAEILALPPVTVGRDPITERTLRPIVAEPVWATQRARWSTLVDRPASISPDAVMGDPNDEYPARRHLEIPTCHTRSAGAKHAGGRRRDI
jgi:hypothetical protein